MRRSAYAPSDGSEGTFIFLVLHFRCADTLFCFLREKPIRFPSQSTPVFTGDGHGDCSTFEDEQEKVQDGGNDGDDHSKDVAEIKDDLPEQK